MLSPARAHKRDGIAGSPLSGTTTPFQTARRKALLSAVRLMMFSLARSNLASMPSILETITQTPQSGKTGNSNVAAKYELQLCLAGVLVLVAIGEGGRHEPLVPRTLAHARLLRRVTPLCTV